MTLPSKSISEQQSLDSFLLLDWIRAPAQPPSLQPLQGEDDESARPELQCATHPLLPPPLPITKTFHLTAPRQIISALSMDSFQYRQLNFYIYVKGVWQYIHWQPDKPKELQRSCKGFPSFQSFSKIIAKALQKGPLHI